MKQPPRGYDVQRYSDRNGSSKLGCTSLPQVLTKALPKIHFPEELHSIIEPGASDRKRDNSSSVLTMGQKYKRKVTIDFNKLEANEKESKNNDDEPIERKMSIQSEVSSDDGDYGINHYESGSDDQFGGEEEATF